MLQAARRSPKPASKPENASGRSLRIRRACLVSWGQDLSPALRTTIPATLLAVAGCMLGGFAFP